MTEPESKPDLLQQLKEQLGGPTGMVLTALPVVAFVVANALVSLPVAIGIALAVAVAVAGWRLARKEPVSQALSGVFGVAVACAVAAWTGSADGYFLLGIWLSLGAAVLLLATVVARRPVTGVVWNLLHGGRQPWRQDRPTLRAHDIATLTLVALFAARFVVQRQLYDSEATGWLAFAKIAMGTPLLAVALIAVVWAFRRSTKRLAVVAPEREREPAR